MIILNILNISNNPITSFPTSIQSQLLIQLQMSTIRIYDFNNRKFRETNNLTILSLASNQIEYLNENQFKTLHHLQDLDISNNRLKI